VGSVGRRGDGELRPWHYIYVYSQSWHYIHSQSRHCIHSQSRHYIFRKLREGARDGTEGWGTNNP